MRLLAASFVGLIRSRRLAAALFTLILSALVAGCGADESATGAANPPGDVAQANAAAVPDSDAPAAQPAQAQITPTNISPEGEPMAASVNGVPITVAQLARERERRMMGLTIEPATLDAFSAMVLESLIDQQLIVQAADQGEIVVTDAEIDNELAIQAELAAANNTTLEQVLADQLYTLDEYRAATRDMLLWNKVSQMVTANVSTAERQVHSRHILVKDEALARDLLAQIQAGALTFEDAARQYSLDGSSSYNGGDLDWVGRGDLLQPEVEAAIFALQPGEMASQPVRSSLGYHLIQTLEVAEGRALDPAALAQQKEQAFLYWLDQQRAAADIRRY